MPLSHRLVVLVSILAACGQEVTTALPPADVVFSVDGGKVTGPDSIAAGWTRVRVEEDGGGHRLVIFRLADTAFAADHQTFLAALDSANTTPPLALALGGPEVGDVVVQLTPGRYLLGCVRRGRNGHRHATSGEAKALLVTNTPATGRAAPPPATQEMTLVDFAYVGAERWPAGQHMLRVHNEGSQDHQLILVRLRPGTTMRDWMNADDSGDLATSVAGVARMGPGTIAYLPVELPAGDYVAYCLIPERTSGREHIELGMLRSIHVQ